MVGVRDNKELNSFEEASRLVQSVFGGIGSWTIERIRDAHRKLNDYIDKYSHIHGAIPHGAKLARLRLKDELPK